MIPRRQAQRPVYQVVSRFCQIDKTLTITGVIYALYDWFLSLALRFLRFVCVNVGVRDQPQELTLAH